ncbi:MAG: galactose-1-phosphate uridylyltransferase [Parvibaculum sp.]|nr:galactose-1-phosphate uridylyltransferase [Parvibaculum sp.]
MPLNMHRHVKSDGRELLLYSDMPLDVSVGVEIASERGSASHMRWHPLRGEWVVYAAARQARTFLPQANDCPLCPARDGHVSEIPFSNYDIAVFENRFPAFSADAALEQTLPGENVKVATGRCEVLVYSSDHNASIGQLSNAHLSRLIAVWGERVSALRIMGYPCVLPFENRGEEIGVTLHHPHGQIYAFSFVPAQLQRAAEAQASVPVIAQLLETLDRELLVRDESDALSFVPPFAMHPYEIWLAPRRRVASPELLNDMEREALAVTLGDAVRRLDKLFGKPMPYILTVQTAPRGFEDTFHMMVEIKPFLRDVNKLKYLAGVEQGAGVFLVDVLPEQAAQKLRAVL